MKRSSEAQIKQPVLVLLWEIAPDLISDEKMNLSGGKKLCVSVPWAHFNFQIQRKSRVKRIFFFFLIRLFSEYVFRVGVLYSASHQTRRRTSLNCKRDALWPLSSLFLGVFILSILACGTTELK